MFETTFLKENFSRIKEIAAVLSKYEMDDLIERLHLPKIFFTKKAKLHLSSAEKIRYILQELGPTYIKFGQILSCHPEIIPADIINQLDKLRDQVTPANFASVKKTINDSFDKPLEEIFMEFNPVPLASASIAQVHTAQLKNGEKVVVKVQHPNLEKKIRKDMDLLIFFGFLLEKYVPEMKKYDIPRLISEFKKSIEKEIDFRIETNSFDHFRSNFSTINTIYFPKVHHEYCTQYVLTMEYIQGAKIDSIIREKNPPHDKTLILERTVNALYKQIFEDGFFHADPHSGNIIIMKNDIVCFIDAGMVGVLNPDTQNFLANLLIAIADKNVNSLISLFLNEEIIPEKCNLKSLKEDLENLFSLYFNTDLENINLSQSLNKFISLIFKYRIKLPSNFGLLIRSLIVLEGICRQLDPKFNPTRNMIPYAENLMKREYHPLNLVHDFNQFVKSNLWMMKSLPNDLLLFTQRVIKGKAELKLDHQGLEELNRTLIRASSRLTSGILIAGTITSSALAIKSNLPPNLFGYSVLGILGYLLSFVAAIIILLRIIRDIK